MTCPMPARNLRHWTPEELALLGTDDDEVVAERLGRNADAVYSCLTAIAKS